MGESSFFDERSHNIIPGTEKILNTTGVDFVIISSAQEGVIYYKMFNSQENNLSSYTNDLDKYLEKIIPLSIQIIPLKIVREFFYFHLALF